MLGFGIILILLLIVSAVSAIWKEAFAFGILFNLLALGVHIGLALIIGVCAYFLFMFVEKVFHESK